MKKKYEVIGNMSGLKRGQIIEADAASVEASGLLGNRLKDLGPASTPEPAVHAASDAPKGNGGQTPNTSPTASATPAPAQKPAVPPTAPKPAAPAGVVKPAVSPAVKPAVAPK